jgi:tetratricopeptide (TPR) repeat protein
VPADDAADSPKPAGAEAHAAAAPTADQTESIEVTLDTETSERVAPPRKHVAASVLPNLSIVEQTVAPASRVERAQEIIEACKKALKLLEPRSKSDPAMAARLHFEAARQYEFPIRDLDAAADHYRRALATRPDHLPSIRGARRVAFRRGDLAGTLALFDMEIERTRRPERRMDLLMQKASALVALGRQDEARATWKAAVEFAGNNAAPFYALALAERRAAAWPSLEQAYDRLAQITASDGRHRAALLVEWARVSDVMRNDAATACDLLRSALAADSATLGALPALGRLLYAKGRWHELVEVELALAEQTTEPALRGYAYLRMSRILVYRLGRMEEGIAAIERAHADLPNDIGIVEELSRLYEAAAAHGKWARSLEILFSLIHEPSARAGLAYRIARIYEEHLNDAGRAIHWHTRELERDPTFAPAAEALAALYERHEQWQPLVTMRMAEAEGLHDGASRAQAFYRVGELVEQRLNKPDEAIALYGRALAAQPGFAPAFNSMTRLLASARRWPELIEVHEQLASDQYDADTRLTNLFKIGRLYEDALGDFAKAYHAYARALEVRASHGEAMHAMQRVAERGELHEQLIHALELEANSAQDPARRLALLHRAAEVRKTKLNQLDAAIAIWKSILEQDARYEPALHAIASAFRSAGHWEEWLEISRRILPMLAAGTGRAALQYELGRVSEDKLGRVEPAMRWYREALGSDPKHELALLALDQLLDRAEKWSDLAELLASSEPRLAAEPRRKAQLAVRIGELYEHRLNKLDDARAAYERALEAVPGFRPAVEGRMRLLSVGRVDARLGDALGQEAEASTDVRHALRTAFQAAQVWRDQMRDAKRAVLAFEFVVTRDPSNIGALLALEILYEEAGAWDSLVRVLNVLSTVLTEPTSRITVLRRLAEVLEQHELGTTEQVLAVWVKILEIDPTNVGALEALELLALRADNATLLSQIDARLANLLDDPALSAMYQTRLGESLEASHDASAIDVLARALERDPEDIAATRAVGRLAAEHGDVQRLEMAAERECATTRDLEVAARFWLTAAELRIAANDVAGATKVIETALEHYPEHAMLATRLRDLLLAQGGIDRLVTVLSHTAGRCRTSDRALDLRLMVAQLLADVKHDVPAAIALLERAATTTQTQAPALLALGMLYTRDGNHAKAAERFERVLSQQPTQDQALEARLALATAYDQHLDRPAQAAKHLEAALQINPDDARTLRGLVEVRVRRGEFESAAEIASRWLRVESEPRRRADGFSLLGRVERARGNTGEAISAYEQSIRLAGLEGTAASELVELLGQQRRAGHASDYQGYVNALSNYVEQRPVVGPTEVRVYQELARVLDAELGQRERAVAILERALAAAPLDVSLRCEIAAILERQGNLTAAIDAYRRVIEIDGSRADAFRGVSRALEHLDRRDDAVVALAPLLVLGSANEAEQHAVGARATRPAALERSLEVEELVALGMPSPVDPTGALLTSIADALDRIDSPNLEQFGLVSRDRIGPRSGHPLRTVADRVGVAVGAGEFEFYVSSNVTSVCIEPGDPPCIIAPMIFNQVSEALQIFGFGRVLTMLGRKWQATERLPLATLESWVGAAVRVSEGGDEPQTRRLVKALAWGRKGRVEEAGELYVKASRPSVSEFVQRARMGAVRVSALLADDLSGCVNWLRRSDPSTSNVIAQDLLRFWIQDAAFSVRKRLGITQ